MTSAAARTLAVSPNADAEQQWRGCTRRAEEVERVEARDAADDKRAGGRNARRGCELVQLGGGVRLACVGAASASVNSRGHAVGVRRAAT